MKNLYLFISLFICIGAYSQTTKSLQQDTVKHYIYVDIMGITKALRTTMSAKTTQTVNIFIDFGEGKIYTPENLMKDKGTDQPISFKSMVEVLNYFSKQNLLSVFHGHTWPYVQYIAQGNGYIAGHLIY